MSSLKIKSLIELYDHIPEKEFLLVDVLRQITIDALNGYGKEKISYNVPFFHGNKSICLIWPASVPRGGVKSGVMFSFWYGNKLKDEDNYLTHGTNKQIFYKIYQAVDEIDEGALVKLLQEAIELDKCLGKR
ncbi:DUF1801 domain-containing protein [Moheibacter sediminis]|uniref:YdhG-like domain-containing protein n=1 Tax=Moheibacter sediminis TaxID=1434700 RepID=A0A1W2BCN7_9FLAO|nr:DUF1801 domain-containing protein [Moheibacter sediminis]SMC70581.1 protein of unknown function (DU1801) [Moheibacter sediminis]